MACSRCGPDFDSLRIAGAKIYLNCGFLSICGRGDRIATADDLPVCGHTRYRFILVPKLLKKRHTSLDGSLKI